MADANGAALAVGDRVEIVQMDDPPYLYLVGAQGVIDHIPEEAGDTQVTMILDASDPRAKSVFGLSTQQAWVKKIAVSPAASPDSTVSSEPAPAPVNDVNDVVEG